ncbi:nitroreductase [Pseudoblastomonas halimionae]|uniref:Nitroreductase n=1 Tax=Alteriqipengyuania halimionae TaxID=1926630 RepID=A0A6I4U3Q3_9SPHN|nr:nitroreductase [Alteriqipengyuania halimionae]MXP09071.1 nitroreductase [Alteriqipengyuania halimionae]
MKVTEAVQSRRSVRAFTDQPVELETLRRVLDTARWAPSGCNYQPWEATVLTGEPLEALRAKLRQSEMQKPEYDWDAPKQEDRYKRRLYELSASMFQALGVAREDTQGRMAAMARNTESFGAPALLLCYFPRLMKEAQWSDTGMWLQTVMLLLREAGLDSCPQEYMAYFAEPIMEHIGVSRETHMFFCGLAIGYRDEDAAVNNFERDRVPLDETIRWQGW